MNVDLDEIKLDRTGPVVVARTPDGWVAACPGVQGKGKTPQEAVQDLANRLSKHCETV
jgi:hypothetical protein